MVGSTPPPWVRRSTPRRSSSSRSRRAVTGETEKRASTSETVTEPELRSDSVISRRRVSASRLRPPSDRLRAISIPFRRFWRSLRRSDQTTHRSVCQAEPRPAKRHFHDRLDSKRSFCFDPFRSESEERPCGSTTNRQREPTLRRHRAARHQQVLWRRPGAARRQPVPAPRRGARAAGRERRRQVDAGEGPRRRRAPRHRRHARRRRDGRLPLPARRPRRRHRGHLPGADAVPRPEHRGERRHGLPPARRAAPDRPRRDAQPRPGPARPPRRAPRPRAPGPRPLDRRPADRRDRQGAELRGARADHGRADRRAVGPGGRAAVRGRPDAARGGRRRPLHLAPPRRGVRDLRHGHRDARRRRRARRADRRHDARRDGQADGRARAQRAVPQAGRRGRRDRS